jgi:hypothetical protein
MREKWPKKYPTKEQIHAEVAACVDSFLAVLYEVFTQEEIKAIYWKGSSYKAWDSIIDYVPEFSDVDIHVHFKNPADAKKRMSGVTEAAHFSKRLEEEYLKRIPEPFHTPALQFMIGQELEKIPHYMPSPRNTVKVIYGEEYPEFVHDQDKAERTARQQLDDYQLFLNSVPGELMFRYRHTLGGLLREFVNRISPAAPRSLVVLGMDNEQALSCNRTQLVAALREKGEVAFAENYELFYRKCWEYIVSGHNDFTAAREAIEAGVAVLSRSVEIAHIKPISVETRKATESA